LASHSPPSGDSRYTSYINYSGVILHTVDKPVDN